MRSSPTRRSRIRGATSGTGRERIFLKVTYATVLAFPIAILLFHDGQTRLRYFDPYPRESLISITGDPGVTSFLQDAYAVIAYGFLAAAFIVLVARKLWQASPRTRRILAPLLLVPWWPPSGRVYNSVVAFVSPVPEFVAQNVFWWQITALIALPFALFVGLIRSRLAHASIGDLVLRLENVTPAGIRDELATALRDPTLEVFFWLPERSAFVDVHGLPVELPEDGPTRAVTMLEHEGEPLAAVVHDPILRDEPELIEVAAAAARLALENARLQAEVQAQLAKVKESRARIVAAGDEQRRRIERDLHDGAQQRLVALALELKKRSAAARRAGRSRGGPRSSPTLPRKFTVAVKELRELAAGIHPGILTQGGLAVALEALRGESAGSGHRRRDGSTACGRRSRPPPTSSRRKRSRTWPSMPAPRSRRSPPRAQNGTLVIEVADDGVGARRRTAGPAYAGSPTESRRKVGGFGSSARAGEGTRIVGEIPCG